jgi:phosphoribosylaminoimidazolecarboxamide formyltransferase / IMP cyclohydrolase
MPTALLSVSDKQGLIEFAGGLQDLGWDLIASGGTAAALRQSGLSVEDVENYTGSPEILGGRVKTLHPAVHGGILAQRTTSDALDLEKIRAREIDLVAVNLYPFEETIARAKVTLAEAVENIDIGGVALIRAAAKNFARVSVLTDPGDYIPVLAELKEQGEISNETRCRLAQKAFRTTATYDTAIGTYLSQESPLHLQLSPIMQLRYGENPHQEAVLYSYSPDKGPLGGQLLQGKALSYNNILDLDAAWRAALSYEKPTICIVKHLSPCGIASAPQLVEAFRLALASDPVSAFGGVIAANIPFDSTTAQELGDLFVECIIAPGFSSEAKEILRRRKNCRLVEMPNIRLEPDYELRSINQGLLRQTIDQGDPPDAPDWKVVSDRPPSEAELLALHFAWKACQHVKSNAIVFAKGEATVGIGGGQPNRVNCVEIAAARAGQQARGAVMASDAFFPFPDSIEEAARVGVTAIVHPGGSVRDAESIAAANAHQIAMLVTGVRHFRH